MAALGDLVAGVAHEMNSPVGVVTGAIDVSNRCISRIERALVELNHDDPALQTALKRLRDNLRVTTEAGDRIANIVQSLKTFARLDEADYQRVDIHDGLDSSLTLIENELRGRIAVEKYYADSGLVTCYASQLNQVFITILKNAAAAIEDTGVITVRTHRENEHMKIEIADTGCGMSEDRLRTLFDFGFSAGGTRVKMRSGLSSAYNIIQKRNGQIRAESAVGKGTTFYIDLPVE